MRFRVGLFALAGLVVACGDGVDFSVVVETATPAGGPLTGGQTVNIEGEGFLEGGASPTLVLVGGRLAAGATVLSDTQVQIITPPGDAPGAVDVVVFNDHGFASAAAAYTYNPLPTITAVSPANGPLAGGTEVTLTGTGFQAAEAGTNLVHFDGVLATSVTVSSDTELVAVTPPRSKAALIDVSLTNQNGGADASNGYAYLEPGIVVIAFQSFFGFGAPPHLAHVDLVTGQLSDMGELRFSFDTGFFDVDSLAHLGGGRFVGGGRNGQFMATDLDGNFESRGQLPLRRMPGMALLGGTLYGIARDVDNGIHTFGSISPDDATYTEIATPNFPSSAGGNVMRGLCLTSDGTKLYALIRDTVANQYTFFELDPVAGEPVAGTEVIITTPNIDRIHDLAFFDGEFYVLARIPPFVPIFGGGTPTTLYRLNTSTGGLTPIAVLPTSRVMTAIQ